MFLEPFDCHSWSNRPCATKIQSNVLDGWQGSMVTDAIHAVCPVPHHVVVPTRAEPEDSSVKLEYQSSDSHDWLFLSSGCRPRLKSQIDKHLPCPFLLGPCLCLCADYNHCQHSFLNDECENHLQKKKSPTVRKIFLASPSLGPPSTIFFSLPFRILCLFFNKECSSCSFESTSAFSFASPSPHLAAPERSRLPSILGCRPVSKNTILHHQCDLAHWLLRLWPIVHIRLQTNLRRRRLCSCCHRVYLLGCRILHWTCRRTEQIHKQCFLLLHENKQGHSFLWYKRYRKSLSLGFTERALATMNINGVKLSLSGNDISWLDTCVACQWCLVAWTLESRGSSFLLSFNVFWGHDSEILTISLFLAHDGHW